MFARKQPADVALTGKSSSGDLDRRHPLRAVTEAFISLILAVVLFRTFAAEGYMISTGSMAPALLGYHKRVTCPTCGWTFPFGVAYDTDPEGTADNLPASRSRAACPNCGQTGVQVADVPRNHGDQLLVSKQAFEYRSPRRWEVLVFRNPGKPQEAYVKRLVGLPSERIRLVAGDVEINGELARKGYYDQLETRILVHDHDFLPTAERGAAARWQPVVATERTFGWQLISHGFRLQAANENPAETDEFAWVAYHHGLPSGPTSVHLSKWPDDLDPATVPPAGLIYSPEAERLTCKGPLPESVRDFLLTNSKERVFRLAVDELYAASHAAPILDRYGYNPPDEEPGSLPIRDLMLEFDLEVQAGLGEFAIEMQDGLDDFLVILDFSRGDVRVHRNDEERPIVSAALPVGLSPGPATVLCSLFDRQILMTVNGRAVFEPILLEPTKAPPPTRRPVRFGAKRLDAIITKLKLYRDIYYTTEGGRNGVDAPYQLGTDEYFVLGDNSPVSHDSRRWYDAPVPKHLVVGKPFLVHLPSKPGRLRIGNYEMLLRMPDWSRIRWIW